MQTFSVILYTTKEGNILFWGTFPLVCMGCIHKMYVCQMDNFSVNFDKISSLDKIMKLLLIFHLPHVTMTCIFHVICCSHASAACWKVVINECLWEFLSLSVALLWWERAGGRVSFPLPLFSRNRLFPSFFTFLNISLFLYILSCLSPFECAINFIYHIRSRIFNVHTAS